MKVSYFHLDFTRYYYEYILFFPLVIVFTSLLFPTGTRECKDLDIDVQCDHRVRTTRETNEEDGGTYIISAVVPAEP